MRHIARRGIKIVHAYNFYGNVFAVPPARLAAPVVIASIRDCAEAVHVEQELMRERVGVQDQYLCAHGGRTKFRVNKVYFELGIHIQDSFHSSQIIF